MKAITLRKNLAVVVIVSFAAAAFFVTGASGQKVIAPEGDPFQTEVPDSLIFLDSMPISDTLEPRIWPPIDSIVTPIPPPPWGEILGIDLGGVAYWPPDEGSGPGSYFHPADSCIEVCGDFNHDGKVNIVDITSLLGYLYGGTNEPFCYEEVDVDDYEVITLSDLIYMLQHPGELDCPPSHPKLSGPVDTNNYLELMETVFPANETSLTLHFNLTTSVELHMMTLPLRIRVASQTPTVTNCQFTPLLDSFINVPRMCVIDTVNGKLLFSAGNITSNGVGPLSGLMATVDISISPSSGDRPITVVWDPFPPVYDDPPVYNNEYSHYPLLVEPDKTAWTPHLVPVEWLIIPSVSVAPCDSCGHPNLGDAVQPVITKLTQPIKGASIPIEIPEEVDTICECSFEGLLTEDWDLKDCIINYDSNYILVFLANTQGYRIPEDTTTVVNILFTASRECTTSYYIHWDTALSDDPLRHLLFADTNNMDLPAYFDQDRDSTEIKGYIPGDVQGDGQVNIADITCLVSCLFGGNCECICVWNAADVNGSCTGPNIADLTYLVDYLFQGGPPPVCCLGGGGAAPKLGADIFVNSVYKDGITTITLSSPVALRGLQLELEGTGAATPVSLLDARLDLLYGEEGDGLAVGLLDLEGEAIIEAGAYRVIQLDGKVEIVEAIVSDMNHNDMATSIGASKQTTLPTEFALNQNYPNPFNPVTEISFSLPNAADVKLDIYNVMGQKVTTLINGLLDAGEHIVQWDGRDSHGSSVASGIYFYRIEVGNIVETKKMMLLK